MTAPSNGSRRRVLRALADDEVEHEIDDPTPETPQELQLLACAAASLCACACAAWLDGASTRKDTALRRARAALVTECEDCCSSMADALSREIATRDDTVRHQVLACIAVCRACRVACLPQAARDELSALCAAACSVCEESCEDFGAIAL